jgi:hypothetical protein
MAFRPKATNAGSRRTRPSGAYPAALSPASAQNNKPVRPSPLSFVPPPSPSYPPVIIEEEELTAPRSPGLAPEGQAQIRDTLKTFPLFKDAPEDFLNRVAKKLRPQVHMPRDEIVFLSQSCADAFRSRRAKTPRRCISLSEGLSLSLRETESHTMLNYVRVPILGISRQEVANLIAKLACSFPCLEQRVSLLRPEH